MCAFKIREVILSALPGQSYFWGGRFPSAQCHHPVLRRAKSGFKRFFEITAADLHKMATFFQAPAT
jgi:hypothetical protein